MKYLLVLFLITIAGCIKHPLCNQRTLIPLEIKLWSQESFSYVHISVSSEYVDPLVNWFFYGDQTDSKSYSKELDVTDDVRSIPRGGKIIVAYKFFSLDGSFETHLDTLVKQ